MRLGNRPRYSPIPGASPIAWRNSKEPGVEGSSLDEDLAERAMLFQDPGVHRRDQGVSRDEVHLEREDAEEHVAADGLARHWRVSRRAGRWVGDGLVSGFHHNPVDRGRAIFVLVCGMARLIRDFGRASLGATSPLVLV
jgi:hypothetical protein